MLFNSLDYFLFLGVVFCVYWLLRSFRKDVIIFLLAVSAFFYMSWNPKYIILILFSCSLDFFCGWMIYKNPEKPAVRKGLLLLSLFGSLSVLFFFKYFNFAMDSVLWINQVFGTSLQVSHVEFLLPVGISFYTFQTLSYTIDIYRGQIVPERNFLRYVTFVIFFPQLVAGPIVRASYLLPKLAEEGKKLDPVNVQKGLFLIMVGLFKKIVIADFLARAIVDPVFDMPLRFSGVENLLAVYAYALQIYNDFSGYSDIAIGSAMLLGYELPVNFNSPYKAVSLQDFWRRWHISLSTWLRDYLYIALGGNRKGPLRTYVNLALTMLLGGLWHGASWKFVIWGALHGVGLAVTRFFGTLIPKRTENQAKEPGIIQRIFGILVTFHFVCLAWIFFRARDMQTAFSMIGNIVKFDSFSFNVTTPEIAGMILLGFVLHFLPGKLFEKSQDFFVKTPALVQAFILLGFSCLIYIVATGKPQPFIYFQF